MLYFVLKLCAQSLESLPLPPWTGFNAAVQKEVPACASVTYLPVIDGSATDMLIVNTILCRRMDFAEHLDQKTVIIVCDQAIHAKIYIFTSGQSSKVTTKIECENNSVNICAMLDLNCMECGLISMEIYYVHIRTASVQLRDIILSQNQFVRIKLFDQTSAFEEEVSDDEENAADKELSDGEQTVSPGNGNSNSTVIKRDFSLTVTRGLTRPDWEPFKKQFELSDVCYFTKCGMEAIIEDDVTQRFKAGELTSWNLLTRTNKGHQFASARLTVLWCIGFVVRYFILFPFRFCLAVISVIWLITSNAFIGYLPSGSFKRYLYRNVFLMTFRMIARSCSAVITFHNEENRAKNGICVANHTSPVDVFMLSCDNAYAMVGQVHGGLLGLAQRALGRATSHVFFERSEVKDRHLVARRLKEHVNDPDRLPILIFPEGTCINNTSVMMFKKGSFEVSTTIYPVAIKYDLRFGDAFWDSSKHGMVGHLFNIMTSWAIVCDIWYMPPMYRKETEDAVEFASRVKREIARQGGLVDLEWDGQLKRTRAKESWKQKPQEQYSSILKVD